MESTREVSSENEDPTGQLLNERYQVERILGRGSFGAVFLAQDIKLKRACVVKQMRLPEGRSTQTLAVHVSNFEREAGLLVQLNQPGHPNIPEIYDYFDDRQGTYLVMKYIKGQSLRQIIETSGGNIRWREAVRYMVDVSSALHYMHTTGNEPIMHRDIKPDNILLGGDDRVWLVDFGLAKATAVEGSGDLMSTQISGSVGYAPLEQWLGEASPASDVYAVGATLFHMVTGVHPAKDFGDVFDFQKLENLHKLMVPIRQIDRSLPRTLETIIIAATATNPAQRPSAHQLQQELEVLIAGPQNKNLFTFKNGQEARNIKELVKLCEENKAEAQAYLYHGDFERWFRLINRNDLADAAIEAVAKGKDEKDGLKKFIRLIVPNLFLKYLGQTTYNFARLSGLFISIMALATLCLIGAGVTGTIVGFEKLVRSSGLDLSQLSEKDENRFSEETVNATLTEWQTDTEDLITLDFIAPNQIELDYKGEPLPLIILARIDDGIPELNIVGLDNIGLIWTGNAISHGINRGLQRTFMDENVEMTGLTIEDKAVIITIKKLKE